MPEGDTIYRTAVSLRPALEGGRIARAQLRDRQFEAESLVGVMVTSVEARGKHLLMHLDADGAIHSHMGMTGSWHIYRPGEPWLKPTRYASLQLAVELPTAPRRHEMQLEVICFSPKLLELLTADQLRRHPHLTRLGPDLLAADFDVAEAVARFRAHNGVPLGEAVMNQTIVCGIGNVYKSDLLFLMGFDPFAAVERFTDSELTAMIEKGRGLMRRNLTGAPRQTRYQGDGRRLWCYGRSGEACFKCGTKIRLSRQGEQGRTTCWCPSCQPSR
jgi:endonuclease-8